MSEFGPICVIALERMAYLDAGRILRTLRALTPQQPIRIYDRGHATDHSDILVDFDGHQIALMAVDGRLPEPEFSGALAESPFWPGSARIMAGHEAFVVVAAAHPAMSPARTAAQAVAQTRIAAVLSEILPTLGCYWQGNVVPVAPDRLRRAVGDLHENKWPADLWIGYDFRGRDSDGGLFIGVRSKGAQPYIGAELDVPPRHVRDQAEILRFLYHALADMMTRGRKVRDGEPVRMTSRGEAWHQVRYVSHGAVPVVALRELEEPIWGVANVSA